MKKIFLLTAVGLTLAVPADGVQKCVALNSSTTTCTTTPSNYNTMAEWAATCTTGGTSVPVSGVWACSSEGDGSLVAGDIYSGTLLKSIAAEVSQAYCYCRLISPAVSSWVYVTRYTSRMSCQQGCPTACAGNIISSSAFRTSVFSNLSD